MKNKIFKFAFIIFFLIVPVSSNSQEQFNFDITQIDILQNGNKFVGTKRGTITSNNGIEINADEFEYDKKLNVLNDILDIFPEWFPIATHSKKVDED